MFDLSKSHSLAAPFVDEAQSQLLGPNSDVATLCVLQKEGGKEGDLLELEEPPRHLARISAGSNKSHLTAAALSPDGCFVAVSNPTKVIADLKVFDMHIAVSATRTNTSSLCDYRYLVQCTSSPASMHLWPASAADAGIVCDGSFPW
eukprot:scaffold33018_cov38-Prasinocladus_malaysianus.AAC.1